MQGEGAFECRNRPCYTQRGLGWKSQRHYRYMPKILIIADDLTGAADCGAMFADRGFTSMVLLAGPECTVEPEGVEDVDVLAIDAHTRCREPDKAAACVVEPVRVSREIWSQEK